MSFISNNKIILVSDAEYTCFGASLETAWAGPNQYKEIVQIAAIKLNIETGKELATFTIFVRPTINPLLSKRFIDLTHITQEQVDKHGVPFEKALTEYVQFCGQLPMYIFSGDSDVFEENCRLHKLAFPFKDEMIHRVKPKLSEWGFDQGNYSSGTLYKAVGLKMDGHVHNALHDVRSMGAFLHYIHTH